MALDDFVEKKFALYGFICNFAWFNLRLKSMGAFFVNIRTYEKATCLNNYKHNL